MCKDVFEEQIGVSLEVFSPGADGGIDLRYIAPSSNATTIIQCKHWIRSGRAKLIKHFEKSEAAKVKLLAPDRYIVATSAEMNPSGKAKLFDLLTPYLQSPSDIYGLDEILAELSKNPGITKRHLRLWLTSTAVLETLLAKAVHQRAEFFRSGLEDTLRTYAPTPAHDEALEILDDKNVLIVAGAPGVGKTTLAKVIAAQYAERGFKLYELSGGTKEALDVWDEDERQLFYYDDFLGQTTLGDALSKNEDSSLLQLIDRISRTPTKRMLLTTRSYILTQAIQRSEKLDRAIRYDLTTFILDVTKYGLESRAHILYNHLYYSGLPHGQIAVFADPEVHRPIISHPNFNPRLIALTIKHAEVDPKDPLSAARAVEDSLANPEEIWGHMFDNQMEELEVDLTLLLFTLGDPIDLESLIDAQANVDGTPARLVRKHLDSLEGTLITIIDKPDARGGYLLRFHNPSVRDFLRTRLGDDIGLLKQTLRNIYCLEQVYRLHVSSLNTEGLQLREQLGVVREEVEGAFARTFDKSFDENGPENWFGRLTSGIKLGTDIESSEILGRCRTRLDDVWPENATDYGDVVSLVSALRESPEASLLPNYADRAIEWLIERLLHESTDWSSLQLAKEYLKEIGGNLAQVAAETVDENILQQAEAVIRQFNRTFDAPDLAEGWEIVEFLDQYENPEDVAPGLDDFRDYLTSEANMDAIDAREEWENRWSSHGRSEETEVYGSQILDMMSSLASFGEAD